LSFLAIKCFVLLTNHYITNTWLFCILWNRFNGKYDTEQT